MQNHPIVTRQPLRGEVVEPGQPAASTSTLHWLDLLSFIMDRLVGVPGTRFRIGLNSLLMVVPVLGDLIPSVISIAILMVGLNSYRVPRIVAARMVFNSLLDAGLGWIPVVGDLFDLFFKADTRNVRLLQQYAGRGQDRPPSTWRHWALLLGVLALFALLMVLIVLGAMSLVEWIVHLARGAI